MAKKLGWQKGDRAPGSPTGVTKSRVPAPESISDKGKYPNLAEVIYDDYNDKPTYTGHRKGFS